MPGEIRMLECDMAKTWVGVIVAWLSKLDERRYVNSPCPRTSRYGEW